MDYATQDVPTDAEIDTTSSVSRTPLQELQAEFAEKPATRRLFKRLPARGGRLAAEYKPTPLKDAKDAKATDNDASILIASLQRILVYDPEHSEAIPAGQPGEGLVPLGAWAEQPDLDPLGFDNRLMDLLELPHGNATQVVMTMFEGNDLAVGIQSGELGSWSGEGYNAALQDFGTGS